MPTLLDEFKQYNQNTTAARPSMSDAPVTDPSTSPQEDLVRQYRQYNDMMGYGKILRGEQNYEPPSDLRGGSVPRRDAKEVHLQQLGGTVGQDTEQDFFGKPGFENLGARTDLSFNKNFNQMRNKFMDKYPDGRLEKVEDGTVYFKMNAMDQWHEYDPGPKTRFDLRETAGDVVDMAGPAVPAVGAFLTSKGAGSTVGSIVRSAIGAGGGQALLEAEEGIRGYGNDIGEVLKNVGEEAALSTLGPPVVAGPTNLANTVTGKGMFAVQAEARQMQNEARALALRDLMPHQLFDHPFLRRLGMLSIEHSPAINREFKEQMKTAIDRMQAIETRGIPQELPQIVTSYVEQFEQQLRNLAVPIMRLPEQTGQMINDAVDRFRVFSGTAEMAMYRRAASEAPATFDISGARRLADEILQGTPMTGLPQRVETGLLDAAGNPMTRDVATTTNAAEISPAFRRFLNLVMNTDPTLRATTRTLENGTVQTVEPFQQLIELRSHLLDLKTRESGEILVGNEKRLANQLYDELTTAIRAPGDEFSELWQAANDFARNRRETLETWAAIRAAKAGDPEFAQMSIGPYSMAKQFIKPTSSHHLNALRRVLNNDDWRNLQDFFRSDLVGQSLDDMAKIPARLDQYKDSSVLEMMMRPNEVTAMRELGEAAKRFKSSGLEALAMRQQETRPMMNDIMNAGEPYMVNSLRTLLARVDSSGNLDQTLKAGLMDALIDRVVTTEKGVASINVSEFDRLMAQMEKNGSLKFLTDSQESLLKTLQKYTQFLSGTPSDMGTSQAATEAVSKAIHLKPGGILSFIKYAGIGRMYANGSLTKFLSGWSTGAADRFDFPKIKATAGALITLANDPSVTGTDAFYQVGKDKLNSLKEQADKVTGKFLD